MVKRSMLLEFINKNIASLVGSFILLASCFITYVNFKIIRYNSIREEERAIIKELQKALRLVNEVAIVCASLFAEFLKSKKQRWAYYEYEDKIRNTNVKIDLSYKKGIAEKVDELANAIINLSKNDLLSQFIWSNSNNKYPKDLEEILSTDTYIANISRDPVATAQLLQLLAYKLRLEADSTDNNSIEYFYQSKQLADLILVRSVKKDDSSNKSNNWAVHEFIILCEEIHPTIGFKTLTSIINLLSKKNILNNLINKVYPHKETQKRLKKSPLYKLLENAEPYKHFGEIINTIMKFIEENTINIEENIIDIGKNITNKNSIKPSDLLV